MADMVRRNLLAAALGALLSYGFWLSRPTWDPEMRLCGPWGTGACCCS